MMKRISESVRSKGRRGISAQPFHAQLGDLVRAAAAIGRTQQDVADWLRISQKTLECWLADPSASWHREPHYLSVVGTLSVMRVNLANIRRHRAAREAKLAA